MAGQSHAKKKYINKREFMDYDDEQKLLEISNKMYNLLCDEGLHGPEAIGVLVFTICAAICCNEAIKPKTEIAEGTAKAIIFGVKEMMEAVGDGNT